MNEMNQPVRKQENSDFSSMAGNQPADFGMSVPPVSDTSNPGTFDMPNGNYMNQSGMEPSQGNYMMPSTLPAQQPGASDSSSVPSTPMNPAQPSMPSTPTTPAQPAYPSTPLTPARPVIPSTPTTPARPVIPSTPTTPARPSRPRPPRPQPPRPIGPGTTFPIGPVPPQVVLPDWGNLPSWPDWSSILPNYPQPSWGINARFLCASPTVSNLTVEIGNRTIITGMNMADVSRYVQYSRGSQRVRVMSSTGEVYIQQDIYLDGNCTIAIVTSGNRLQLVVISDPGCTKPSTVSCMRVCNLAYYSDAMNVTVSNGLLRYTNLSPGVPTNFSRVTYGTYGVNVARTARPQVNLLSTNVNLSMNRTYTLYVLNWNPSEDAVQVLLTEDM